MLYRSPDIAPDRLDRPSVFLAGSIEMGRAELWQTEIAERFLEAGAAVFDPRRLDWNWDWPQDATPGTPFERQVAWEQDHLARADLVWFRFCAGTASIVSMLELGQSLAAGRRIVIQADPGYMRRANIEIVARNAGVPVFAEKEEALATALQGLGLG